jgi:hypothetical protein
LSEGFLSYPVFNGDMSDLRFLDPKGHVIALYAKENARNDRSGFVRDQIKQNCKPTTNAVRA